jgi:hypothetical protein
MFIYRQPSAVADFLTLLRILEVLGSSLRPETGYPDDDFLGCPQFIQINSGKYFKIRSRVPPSTFFPTHHSVVVPSLEAK